MTLETIYDMLVFQKLIKPLIAGEQERYFKIGTIGMAWDKQIMDEK